MKVLFYPNYRSTTNRVCFLSGTSEPDFVTIVDENLYRGRKPEKCELKQLKDMGITTIVDFSTERGGYNEAEGAAENGIKYVALPFDMMDGPSDEQLQKFFDVTEKVKENNEKIYVHCMYGRDRTGLMVNLYKVHNGLPLNGWSWMGDMMVRDIYNDFCERTNGK